MAIAEQRVTSGVAGGAGAETADAPSRRGGPRWRRVVGRGLIVAFVGSVVLGGTALGVGLKLVDHRPQAATPRPAASVPASVLERYADCPDAPSRVEVLGEARDGRLRIVEAKLIAKRKHAAAPHEVRVHFYLADGVSGRAPTIVVTPILDGQNKVARIIARDVAQHGMHAVIVDRYRLPGEARKAGRLEAMEEEMRDMVADRMRVVDWLLTRPEVDPDRLGAYGVSLGGITTVSLTAIDKRIKAAAAIMAGGDLAAVVCRSVEGECVDLARKNGVPENARSEQLAAFEALARPILETCPVALAPYVDPRQMLLFTTRRDTSVPSFTQERLREALGEPEAYSLPTGHYTAVLYITYMKRKARAFLRSRLDAAAASAKP